MKNTQVRNENDSVEIQNLSEILNDCSIDAIIAVDTNCLVIAWNNKASTIYGHSKKQALGKSLFKLIPGLENDKETGNAIKAALRGYKSFVPASPLHAHRRHVENHYIALNDNDGNIIGVMNIVHDVAHRIKAEQQLEHLNEELKKRYHQLQITSGELASYTFITSSKIKEPIRQVYTSVEHLITTEAKRLTDSGKATFRRIQSSLNRMDLLLDDILKLAQISILEKPETMIDLTEIVNGVCDEIRKKSEKNINFIVEELCEIAGHKDYLHLLFYNLIDNAIKFNESDVQEIKVSCEKTSYDQAPNELHPDTEYYKVTIADNGIGINMDHKEKIFQMFEKLHDKKYKGSGVGLSLVRKIMEAHDGFVEPESDGVNGSCFHCYFPANDLSN